MRDKLLKTLIIILLTILMIIYFKDKREKFRKSRENVTNKIINEFDIRKENFFNDQEYLKNYKKTESVKISKKDVSKKITTKIDENKTYILQIATFAIKENALKIKNSLKIIDEFEIEKSTINKEYYIVVSKSFKTRKEAEELGKKVTKNFKDLKPLVKMRYKNGKSSKH